MSRVKRMLAFVVAMAMVVAMSVTAFAAEETAGEIVVLGSATDNEVANVTEHKASEADKGTVTIENVSSGKINLYQVVGADYKDGYFKGYKSLITGMTISVDTDKNSVTMSKTVAELTNLLKTTTPTKTVDASASGTTEIKDLAIGGYVVLISEVDDGRIYSPMMASVYYDPVTTGTTIKATTIEAKYREGSEPEKSITSVDGATVVNGEETTNIGLGSTIGFKIKGIVPSYDMDMYTNPVYEITDTLSKGLKYKENSVVLPTGVDSNHFSKTSNDDGTTTLTISLSTDEIKNLAGETLEVTYSATVTTDAQVETDLKNTVVIKYSTTPGETSTKEDVTHHYSHLGIIDGILTVLIVKKLHTITAIINI